MPYARRSAAAVLLGALGLWAELACATPPSLPPTNFHPFGPPTELIPDGATVPMRPVRPMKTMSPMFQLPISPFGNLGQNWGALGTAVNIEQRQAVPQHRQPILLTTPNGKAGAAGASGGGAGAGKNRAASSAAGKIPAYRQPLGW